MSDWPDAGLDRRDVALMTLVCCVIVPALFALAVLVGSVR